MEVQTEGRDEIVNFTVEAMKYNQRKATWEYLLGQAASGVSPPNKWVAEDSLEPAVIVLGLYFEWC